MVLSGWCGAHTHVPPPRPPAAAARQSVNFLKDIPKIGKGLTPTIYEGNRLFFSFFLAFFSAIMMIEKTLTRARQRVQFSDLINRCTVQYCFLVVL